MELRKTHDELLERMRDRCKDELRAMGEHELADGGEIIDPDTIVQAAHQLMRNKAGQKAKAKPRKTKAQKQARRKNR